MARRNIGRYDEMRQSTSSGPKDFNRPFARLLDVFLVIFWGLIVALLLRTFLFQPFYIPSFSMAPNIIKGDYVFSSKYAYGYGGYSAFPLRFPSAKRRVLGRVPRRGDVAIFYDERTGSNVVKRIMAFEGESVRLEDGRVFINDRPLEAKPFETRGVLGASVTQMVRHEMLGNGVSYLTYSDTETGLYDHMETVIVPQGHYFVLGDNRDNSADSRVPKAAGGTGLVAENQLIGRAEFILLSVSDDFSLKIPLTWHNLRRDRFFKDIP